MPSSAWNSVSHDLAFGFVGVVCPAPGVMLEGQWLCGTLSELCLFGGMVWDARIDSVRRLGTHVDGMCTGLWRPSIRLVSEWLIMLVCGRSGLEEVWWEALLESLYDGSLRLRLFTVSRSVVWINFLVWGRVSWEILFDQRGPCCTLFPRTWGFVSTSLDLIVGCAASY